MLKYLLKPKGKRREYRGRYRVGDNPKIYDVALHTTVKEVAEKRLKEIFEDAQREEAGLIPGKVTRQAMKRPLMELFAEFIEDVRKREKSKDYMDNLRLRFPMVLKFCGWKTMSDITPKSFLDWRSSNHGYAVRSQNHFFDTICVFLNWAQRTYETPNPLKHQQKLPKPEAPPEGPRTYTKDELTRLFAACPRRRFFCRLLTLTGLRHREASRLIWADVHLDGDNPGLALRREATKSRRPDWIPIPKDLVPEFRAARPVFAKPETRVTELLLEFLEDVREREKSNAYIEGLRLRVPKVAKECGWKTPSDVTAKAFLDWRSAQTQYKRRSLNHFLSDTRTFLNWIERTYEIENPLKRIQKLQVEVNPDGPRALTEDELSKLFSAVPRRSLYYRLIAFSGLRHRESRHLQWRDVRLDGDNPGFFLRIEATKSRRPDWLPIISHLVPLLRAARPVFAKPETRVFWKGVPNITTLHRDIKRAGIAETDDLGRKIGFHTFRRTFISQLQRCGVHSRVTMQLARHKSLRMTDQTYTDVKMLPLREGIESLASMCGIGSPAPLRAPATASHTSPQEPGQSRISLSKAGQAKNMNGSNPSVQSLEVEPLLEGLTGLGTVCPKSEMVGEQGLELHLPRETKSLINADLVDC